MDNCESKEEQKDLDNSSYIEDFRRKWNLNIYFQIRYKDLVAEYEEVLTMPMAVPTFDAYKTGELERTLLVATQRTLRMLSFCWSEKCYLPTLAPKFWKLSLLLLMRYSKWLQKLSMEGAKKKNTNGNDSGTLSPNEIIVEVRKMVSFYYNGIFAIEEASYFEYESFDLKMLLDYYI